MSKRIKIAGLAAVLLLAGYLGTTYLIGYLLEQQLTRQLARFSAQTTGLELSLLSYERAFFSSSLTTAVAFPKLQSDQGAAPSLIIQSDIQHGPLIFSGTAAPALLLLSGDSKIVQTGGAWSGLLSAVPELQELTSSDRLSYLLRYRNRTNFPGLDRQLRGTGQSFNLKLSAITAELQGEFWPQPALQGRVLFPGGSFSLPTEALTVAQQNLRLDFVARQLPETQYRGSVNLKIDSWLLSHSKPGEELLLELAALEVSSQLASHQGLLNQQFVSQFKNLQVNADVYGPMQAEVAVNNLAIAPLLHHQQELRRLPAILTTHHLSSAAVQKRLKNLQPLALSLLQQSPQLEIAQLDLNTPFGKLVGRGRAAIEGEQLEGIEPPKQLLSALDASAELTIGQDLFRNLYQLLIQLDFSRRGLPAAQARLRAEQQATEEIEDWLASQYLLDVGDSYQFAAKVNQGQAIVNGQQRQ